MRIWKFGCLLVCLFYLINCGTSPEAEPPPITTINSSPDKNLNFTHQEPIRYLESFVGSKELRESFENQEDGNWANLHPDSIRIYHDVADSTFLRLRYVRENTFGYELWTFHPDTVVYGQALFQQKAGWTIDEDVPPKAVKFEDSTSGLRFYLPSEDAPDVVQVLAPFLRGKTTYLLHAPDFLPRHKYVLDKTINRYHRAGSERTQVLTDLRKLLERAAADDRYDHVRDTATALRLLEIGNDSLLRTVAELGFPDFTIQTLQPPFTIAYDDLPRFVASVDWETNRVLTAKLLPKLPPGYRLERYAGYRYNPYWRDPWTPTWLDDRLYVRMNEQYGTSYILRWRKDRDEIRPTDAVEKIFLGAKEVGSEWPDTVFQHNGRDYLLWTDAGGDEGNYYRSQYVEEILTDGRIHPLGSHHMEGYSDDYQVVDFSLEPRGAYLHLDLYLRRSHQNPNGEMQTRQSPLRSIRLSLEALANVSQPVDLLYYADDPAAAEAEGLPEWRMGLR